MYSCERYGGGMEEILCEIAWYQSRCGRGVRGIACLLVEAEDERLRLTSVVTANSVVVTVTFISSSRLTPKADMKIIVLNNATRGLANMFAPTDSFVTYPALNATPAPTNDYSVVFTLPPLAGPATYVFTPPSARDQRCTHLFKPPAPPIFAGT